MKPIQFFLFSLTVPKFQIVPVVPSLGFCLYFFWKFPKLDLVCRALSNELLHPLMLLINAGKESSDSFSEHGSVGAREWNVIHVGLVLCDIVLKKCPCLRHFTQRKNSHVVPPQLPRGVTTPCTLKEIFLLTLPSFHSSALSCAFRVLPAPYSLYWLSRAVRAESLLNVDQIIVIRW